MRRSAALALLIVYLLVLLDLTLVQFPQPGAPLNLTPLATIAHDVREGGWGLRMNVGGNLAAFVPLGVLLVWLQGGLATPPGVALASMGLSLTIESFQYLSGQRVADVDDVLLNTLSGLLGFALAAGLDRLSVGAATLRNRRNRPSPLDEHRTPPPSGPGQSRPIRVDSQTTRAVRVDDSQTPADPGRNHLSRGPRIMFPSLDQIERLAYDRWEERGYAHGHDAEDWLAAEQDLLFTLNYEVIVRYRLDGIAPEVLGFARNRRCRFCEQGAPRATFSAPGPVVPESLGATTLLTLDECDDCRALFLESIEPDLERFATPWRTGEFPPEGAPGSISIAAYKGFVRLMLLALPEAELPYVEDALEWVGNPDHDLDGRAFEGLSCQVGFCATPAPFASMALARRIDDEAVAPYLLGFLVTGRATFQVQVPLCVRDEDLDGPDPVMPRVANPPGCRRRPGERVGVTCRLASAAPRQGRRAIANGLPW